MSTAPKKIKESGDETGTDSELPEGWTSTQLDKHVYIAGRIGWKGLKRGEYTKEGPIFLAVKNILDCGEIDFSDVEHISNARYDESPEIALQSGDLLLTKDGTIGKIGMVRCVLPGETTVNSSILVVRPDDRLLDRRFFFHFLRGPQFQDIALQRITGSAVPHLFQKDIKRLVAFVPPLEEQRRIAKTIESVLPTVDNTVKRLCRARALVRRFRETVLTAACSGKLTEDWRQRTKSLGTSRELLARILKHRKAQWIANHVREYDEPFAPRDLQEELPDTWEPTSVDQLTSLVTSGSRGWARYYSDSGPFFIRAENINRDYLDTNDIAHVHPPKGAEGARTRVQIFDLLVTITGANVTKSALVDRELGEAYVSQHIGLVRPVERLTAPYLYLWVLSPAHGRAKLVEDAYGAGKPGLNLDTIREMTVALPPLGEQTEIVRRVDALFKLADAIEKRVAAATLRAKRLTQAVLAKAFRGELVPTEAELARREGREYEPASVRLERIKKESEKVAEKPKQKSQRPGRRTAAPPLNVLHKTREHYGH